MAFIFLRHKTPFQAQKQYISQQFNSVEVQSGLLVRPNKTFSTVPPLLAGLFMPPRHKIK